MPVETIAAALQGVTSAIEIAKALKGTKDFIKHAEAQSALAEMLLKLAETRVALSEVMIENTELKTKIGELMATQDVSDFIERRNGVLIPKDGCPHPKHGSGPWCISCYESSGKLYSLQEKTGFAIAGPAGSSASYNWVCPKCKSSEHSRNTRSMR